MSNSLVGGRAKPWILQGKNPLRLWGHPTRQRCASRLAGRRFLRHDRYFKVFCRPVLRSPGHEAGETLLAPGPHRSPLPSAHVLARDKR